MVRSKHTTKASNARHHTPPRHVSRLCAHTPPMHSTPRYQRHFILEKQKKTRRKSHDHEDDWDDTYSSLLRGMHSGKNDDGDDDGDDASADEIDTNASSEDEDWDETTLIEMLGSSYSNSFFSLYTAHFAHQIEGLQRRQQNARPPIAQQRVYGRFT